MSHLRSIRFWKVIAALVAIFCAGQGFGYILATQRPVGPEDGVEKSWTQSWVDQTMSQLKAELKLTENQVAEIEPALTRAGDKIRTERQRALFQIHLNILDVHSDIESYLADSQKVKLEESRRKLRQRIQREFPEIMGNQGG